MKCRWQAHSVHFLLGLLFVTDELRVGRPIPKYLRIPLIRALRSEEGITGILFGAAVAGEQGLQLAQQLNQAVDVANKDGYTPYIRTMRMKELTVTVPPLVGVIMGSKSDWETMQHTVETLNKLGVPFETRVVSAHRTPDLLFAYAGEAEGRGLEVIIAGAGGAAHLPGMAAAKTTLPVLGVPVQSKALNGMDSLLSIVQMPAGIPVGTLAIGRAGAINAALLATAILANKYEPFRIALREYREQQTQTVLENPNPEE